jgi:hypothetical protein
VNIQRLLKCYAGFVGLRGGIDPGLNLTHKLLGAPSSLAQADPVNPIDLDPDRADVPAIPTDITMHRIGVGRLVRDNHKASDLLITPNSRTGLDIADTCFS